MKISLIAILSIVWATLSSAAFENIALNKPYTLSPSPNYSLCTDPGDKTQLTDGLFASEEDMLWVQKESVGWQDKIPVQCVIDLGRVEPISGASWSTAARGLSQVE